MFIQVQVVESPSSIRGPGDFLRRIQSRTWTFIVNTNHIVSLWHFPKVPCWRMDMTDKASRYLSQTEGDRVVTFLEQIKEET